jgi:aspartyl-tRNA(Asn)/glutamyl-tRNA(Gln) amidotransferase subunit A
MPDRSILEMAQSLRDGSTKAETVIEEAVARHERLDPALMAYKHWDGERALREARAVDTLISAGLDTGVMMGLPFSAKDIFGVKGMPTCGGTPAELPAKWRSEGPVVGSLRKGLAIATGKTHSVEFAFGGVGSSAHWDTPRNPWDTVEHRVTGGSSSGAGVSLAEGSALLALGTDTGGSVRIPASVTGNVGLKTSIGRWSTEGIVPLSSSFDTPGLLTRSVADAVVAYGCIDPNEDNPEELLARLGGLDAGSLRLGICDEHFWDDCSPGIAEGVKGAIDELTAKGAHLNQLSLPHTTQARERFARASLFGVEGRSYIDEEYPDRLATLDPNILARFELAAEVSAVDYFTEQRQIGRLCKEVDHLLRHVDVLVAPTVPMTPPTVAEVEEADKYLHANGMMTRNTQPINLLALCAITLPVALDKAGMPVGLQLIGRHGEEERVFAAALACERALGTALDRLGQPPMTSIA